MSRLDDPRWFWPKDGESFARYLEEKKDTIFLDPTKLRIFSLKEYQLMYADLCNDVTTIECGSNSSVKHSLKISNLVMECQLSDNISPFEGHSIDAMQPSVAYIINLERLKQALQPMLRPAMIQKMRQGLRACVAVLGPPYLTKINVFSHGEIRCQVHREARKAFLPILMSMEYVIQRLEELEETASMSSGALPFSIYSLQISNMAMRCAFGFPVDTPALRRLFGQSMRFTIDARTEVTARADLESIDLLPRVPATTTAATASSSAILSPNGDSPIVSSSAFINAANGKGWDRILGFASPIVLNGATWHQMRKEMSVLYYEHRQHDVRTDEMTMPIKSENHLESAPIATSADFNDNITPLFFESTPETKYLHRDLQYETAILLKHVSGLDRDDLIFSSMRPPMLPKPLQQKRRTFFKLEASDGGVTCMNAHSWQVAIQGANLLYTAAVGTAYTIRMFQIILIDLRHLVLEIFREKQTKISDANCIRFVAKRLIEHIDNNLLDRWSKQAHLSNSKMDEDECIHLQKHVITIVKNNIGHCVGRNRSPAARTHDRVSETHYHATVQDFDKAEKTLAQIRENAKSSEAASLTMRPSDGRSRGNSGRGRVAKAGAASARTRKNTSRKKLKSEALDMSFVRPVPLWQPTDLDLDFEDTTPTPCFMTLLLLHLPLKSDGDLHFEAIVSADLRNPSHRGCMWDYINTTL